MTPITTTMLILDSDGKPTRTCVSCCNIANYESQIFLGSRLIGDLCISCYDTVLTLTTGLTVRVREIEIRER